MTGAAVFCGDRLIFEPGETARLTFCAPSPVTADAEGRALPVRALGDGRYDVTCEGAGRGERRAILARCGDKVSEVSLFCRDTWSAYLAQAADEAIRCEQKATSHIESWYGYFSGRLALRRWVCAL